MTVYSRNPAPLSQANAAPPSAPPRTQSGLSAEEWFTMGPDQQDIRRSRPYFLVPLFADPPPDKIADGKNSDDKDSGCKAPDSRGQAQPTRTDQVNTANTSGSEYLAQRQQVQARIRAYLLAQQKQPASVGQGPVTDVFVISHGWHRNFYAGISAYDRLSSRLALLVGDGRIALLPGRPFNPLFITLHWHSDPGDDDWMDKSGRRHKASFMEAAASLFLLELQKTREYACKAQPPPANYLGYRPDSLDFVHDFEQMFEYFSELSAPDRSHTWDANMTQNPARLKQMAEDLYGILAYYTLKEDCLARPEDKVVVAWRCYHEADSRGVQVDVEKPDNNAPAPFLSGGLAGIAVARFITLIVGLPAVLLFLSKPVLPFLWHYWQWSLAGIVILIGLSRLLLEQNAIRRQDWKKKHAREKPESGTPLLRLGAYLVLQAVCILPAISRCLLTYLLGGMLQREVTPLYDENSTREFIPKDVQLARYPVGLLKQAIGPDSNAMPLAEGIDSQIAFWEMQRKGVWTGKQAGEFMQELVQANPETFEAAPNHPAPRMHLIGHSFGALVVTNMACEMHKRGVSAYINSLCMLEGAVASGWFSKKPDLVNQITLKNRGVITSIFSRYDTANGYIYPLVNQARQAMGSVGMCPVPVGANMPPITPEWRNGFASLVTPPDLQVTAPCMLNIDASRLIYFGPPALGGGHNDIFKDDVLHLLWAVTHIPARLQSAAQQPKAAEST